MSIPRIVADESLDSTVYGLLQGKVEILPWAAALVLRCRALLATEDEAEKYNELEIA